MAIAIQLGQDWTGKRCIGWLASEKLNGCRCFWDGRQLWTKNGNPINLPRISNQLPPMALDGELYAGVDGFEVARVATQYGHDNPRVRFHVFDAPEVEGNWSTRLQAAADATPHCNAVEVVAWWQVKSMPQLRCAFRDIKDAGGEGVMLRHPSIAYTPGRTNKLLKVKRWQDPW